MTLDGLIDQVLQKYSIPMWVKPYIYDYVKKDPVNAIKRATSFIDVKRKKGVVTNSYVQLPNSTTFKMSSIIHMLSLFLYGTERTAKIAKAWSSKPDMKYRNYVDYYANMVEVEERHARATLNLIEGLGYKPREPTKEVVAVFDYLNSIAEWNKRIIATDLILRSSYGNTFGLVFYRVFYFVMPEFMRSFGKAFTETEAQTEWGIKEAERVIAEHEIDSNQLLEMSVEMLCRIGKSINAEMPLAGEAGIKREAELLKRISIAYPLHKLKDLGVVADISKTEKEIASRAKKLKP